MPRPQPMTIPKTLRMLLLAAALCAAASAALPRAGTHYQATFLEYSKGWGSIVGDFDNDGHDEVWNNGHDRDDRLWYWSPTGYLPGPQVLPYVDRHACEAADFNRDGRLDFYCAVGAELGLGAKLNELWLQDEDGVFHRAVNFGAEDIYGRGRYPIWLDFNHDGWPDLYLTNESTDRPDGQPNVNHLYINQGGTGFVEANTLATGQRGNQCVAKGDIDGDGWDDLLVCGATEGNHLYLNNRQGDFTELQIPVLAASWLDAKLVDMDGDGRDDLVLINGRHLQVWTNIGVAPWFRAATLDVTLPGIGVSIAVGDFDGNGRRDIYAVMQDTACGHTLIDKAPDLVAWGQPDGTYVTEVQPQAGLGGCGHRAQTVEGNKVLLEQGGPIYKGGTYVIRWQ